MKTAPFLFLSVCAVIVFAACVPPSTEESTIYDGIPGNETPLVIASHLFIPAGGINAVTRFFTNDPQYRKSTGCTLWSYCSKEETFHERSVIVRKPTGNLIAGYGLIICAAPRTVNGRTETVFLTIMINNNKEYTIGKVTGASYVSLTDWKTSNRLLVGGENKIRIVKDNDNPNKYELYCNGFFERFFVDEEEPFCEGTGRNGYIVVIAPDDLVTKSVEVWFSE